MEWVQWAHRMINEDGIIFYMNFEPDKRLLALYHLPDPIVQVRLAEDQQGLYRGLIKAGSSEVMFVQRKELFSMQFPYGVRSEVEHNGGRVIRLTVQEVDARP